MTRRSFEANPACHAHIRRRPSSYLAPHPVRHLRRAPRHVDGAARHRWDRANVVFGTDFPFEIGDADGRLALPTLDALDPAGARRRCSVARWRPCSRGRPGLTRRAEIVGAGFAGLGSRHHAWRRPGGACACTSGTRCRGPSGPAFMWQPSPRKVLRALGLFDRFAALAFAPATRAIPYRRGVAARSPTSAASSWRRHGPSFMACCSIRRARPA